MEGEWREKDDGRYERRKGRMGGQGEMEKRRRVKKKIKARNKGGREVEKGIYPPDHVFIHTFSARSLRSRTTVCKMGNPLQVCRTQGYLQWTNLTRSYFISTNHCTCYLDNIFNTSLNVTKVEATDIACELVQQLSCDHSPVLFLLRLKHFQK